MSEGTIELKLEQQEAYRFKVQFGSETPAMLTDEPAPLGTAAGPSPVELLISAVATCLTDSLIFALNKFKQPSDGIRTEASAEMGRNADKRLRVAKVSITLHLGHAQSEIDRLERILDQFEQFCTVSQSVSQCLPVHLIVVDSEGVQLKQSVLGG
ncbi:OsmC family protein [Halopseudomonas pelagia]|uniref:OsmC family protein n=1 Tax=Halopseudomonas pelagia TaxID=553151 RepID=UPI00039DD09E|nr:OsmC family protein [Halopseudomonas pelagia]|tara:strand:- start:751 stop:1215 length:465 start_codon:yes stop_codon:yes gene_type:complete